MAPEGGRRADQAGVEAGRQDRRCVPPFTGASDLPVTLKPTRPGGQARHAHARLARGQSARRSPRRRTASRSIARITVRKLALISPPQPVKAPETQLRIFAAGRGQPTLEASARAIISNFASRAFRRPLAAGGDRALHLDLHAGAEEGREFRAERADRAHRGARLAAFPLPRRNPAAAGQSARPRSRSTNGRWPRASRISSGARCPTTRSSREAQRGTLRKNLAAQVQADARRSRRPTALVENFAGQWLQIRNLAHVQPDAKTFPEWDKPLATAMERETEMLFEHIMREDRPVTRLHRRGLHLRERAAREASTASPASRAKPS